MHGHAAHLAAYNKGQLHSALQWSGRTHDLVRPQPVVGESQRHAASMFCHANLDLVIEHNGEVWLSV